ncbi:hypothetical protein EYC84_005937 [Monilinia fructicola]|uniref:Uncharacterized protein n=1 Tax=Monilinia fructicola TaxID=38448 RepID=A0A5M9JY65_MONFR|nr:hypothetical protein EYC84_005937 [Monilinia fructicola]
MQKYPLQPLIRNSTNQQTKPTNMKEIYSFVYRTGDIISNAKVEEEIRDLVVEVPSGLSTANRFFCQLIECEVGEIDRVTFTTHALIDNSCLSGFAS